MPNIVDLSSGRDLEDGDILSINDDWDEYRYEKRRKRWYVVFAIALIFGIVMTTIAIKVGVLSILFDFK